MTKSTTLTWVFTHHGTANNLEFNGEYLEAETLLAPYDARFELLKVTTANQQIFFAINGADHDIKTLEKLVEPACQAAEMEPLSAGYTLEIADPRPFLKARLEAIIAAGDVTDADLTAAMADLMRLNALQELS